MKAIKINKYFLFDTAVYFLIALISLLFLKSLDYSKTSFFTVLGFYIIGIISFIMIATDRYNISIRRTIYIFAYIFFFIAPLQQYTESAVLWSHMGLRTSYSNSDYNISILAVLVMIILFEIGYKSKGRRGKIFKEKTLQRTYIRNENFFVLVIVSLCAFAFLLVTDNIQAVNNVFSSDAISRQIVNIAKYIPVCSFIVGIMCVKKYGANGKGLGLFIIAAEIIYIFFPFWGSTARFILLGTYVVIYAFFFKDAKYKSLYFLLFFFGFFISFSNFKNAIDMETVFSNITPNFNHVDYDAFQILMLSIKYVKGQGPFYFMNILSAMAFLLPRTVWTGKLEGSGTIVVNYFNSKQDNVSAPMVAEFYLAAGWIGVILLSYILGLIVKKLDNMQDSESYLYQALFCIITGMTVYIQRGSLLASFAFTGGLLLALLAVYLLACVKYKK